MTFAYTVNVLIYGLWQGKPLNVDEPIDVRGRNSAPNCDKVLTVG